MIESHTESAKPLEPEPSESAFRDIRPEELPEYIKLAKTAVMEGFRRHLEKDQDTSEWQSFAFTIGTLSELERMVDRWRRNLPTGR